MSNVLAETKTYVLLDTMDATANVFQQIGDGKRVQIKKIPFHHPTRRQMFYEKSGKSRVIRYKAHSNFIDQDQQIKEEKIEANTPFTPQEKKDLEFRFGVLTTKKIRAQQYLEAHPEYDKFDGSCDDVRQPKYKLLNEDEDDDIENNDIMLRIKAANKVAGLSLEKLQALLLRLNGSFFETPNSIKKCQNMLFNFIDDAEEKGLEAVLLDDENTNIDEQTTVLIGKLINAGTLSFDAVEGKISKKDKNDKWVTIREMSNEYPVDERKRLFSDFLNSPAGKPLKDDLENDLDDEYEYEEEEENGNEVPESNALVKKKAVKKRVVRRKKHRPKKIVESKTENDGVQ